MSRSRAGGSERRGSDALPRPLVSILIVNYHSTPYLVECLDAIAASTIADSVEVFVVDNASPDFDAAALASRYPDVQFLPQTVNTTFTGGTNLAFARAAGQYVLLLNPDTRIEPSSLEAAVARFRHTPGISAQGAFLMDERGALQHYYRRLPRARDIPAVVLPRIFGRTRLGRAYLMTQAEIKGVVRIPQPPGAFLMIPRAFCPTPVLDPGYFNFFSDVELCDQLSRRGPIVVGDDVRCVHARGMAGVRTADPIEQLRLQHDMTWGARRYFSRRTGVAGRAYLELWLGISWALRVANAAARRPHLARRIAGIAAAALSGRRPSYF